MNKLIFRLNYLVIGMTVAACWPMMSAAQPDFSSWARRALVQFPGYNRTETLTNFPALVVLGPNGGGFNYANFLSGTNADLRFTDSSQTTELNYEIEQWNTNGSSYVWVQVPFLTNGASLWVFWGKSGQTAPVYATNGTTWSGGFEAVWHMRENASPYVDSALKHNITAGVTPALTAGGRIGAGQMFDGTNNYLLTGAINLGNQFTLSAWINVDSTATNIQTVLANKVGGNGADGFALNVNTWSTADKSLQLETGNGVAAGNNGTAGNLVTYSAWHHLAVVMDRANSNATLYVDGIYKTAGPVRSDFGNNKPVCIGSYSNAPSFPFKGIMDEVRIDTVLRSSNWVWACTMNQASNNTFSSGDMGFAAIQTDPPTNVMATSASLDGTLSSTGFYNTAVLVFYGPADGGTTVSNWASNTSLTAPQSVGAKSVTVPVDTGRAYFYRYAASNAVGLVWATNSQSFTTPVDFTSWAKRTQIQFPGYNRAETLTNFPALVVLGTNISGFSYADFFSGSNADLRFTDSSQTNQLNYEIEKWDTNGSSYIWVQVPFLTNGASIWTFWGKSGQLTPTCTTNGATWSGNFESVWHLKESASPYVDSVLKHNATNGVAPVQTQNGKIGAGQTFDGTNNYLVTGAINLGNQFTMSAWVNVAGTATNIQTVLASKGGGTADGFAFYVNSWNTSNKILAFETANGSLSGSGGTAANVVTYSVWHHVAAVIDRANSNSTLYVDGVQKGGGTIRSDFGNNKPVYIGQFFGDSLRFDGVLDEVRIDTVLRSSNWVWACAMNQASNSLFSSNSVVVAGTVADVRTDPPSNVTGTSASLNGTLMTTGTSATAVFVYYGPTDYGTNAASWATNTSLAAPQGVGAKSMSVTVPAGGEIFYRYAASNTAGLVWAPGSQYFITTNVAISVTPGTVGEANASATFWFVRPVTATSGAVTVNFTLGGTASNGLDYSSMTASNVTLAPGVTNASLSVTTLPDGVLEGNETLVLTEATGAYVLNTPATTTLTIVDTPTVGTLAPTGVTASSANLNGSVNSATDTAVYVYYGPVNGGTNRASWATVDTSLVAPQGAGAKSVPVLVAANSEFYYRYAASNAGGLVWAPSSQYFITTNIAISVTPTVIGETNAVATFHFSRPVTVTGSTVTVNFMIGGTASNGADYSLVSATNVTLAAGIASATLTVTSLMDNLTEGNETVDLIETSGAYVMNSPATTSLTITDSTGLSWTAGTNTLVLQQGAQVSLNGLVYGNTYTNAVDTYYDQANPNTSYGSSSTVSCCRYSLNDARRGYLRFDNLQGYVPTNAIIISARIELTGAGDGPGSYGGSIYYCASSWSPASTWNTRPDTTGDQVIGSMDPGIWFTWPAEVVHGIDVSAEAQGWLQGTIANNGITFRSPENSDITERNFYSSEYATVSKRPKLTLTYALNTAQVSPTGYERFSPITRTVVMLSGSNTIQDTYIDGDNKTANNVSAATVNLRTAGGQGVKRALLKINTSSGLLSTFANSAAPVSHLDKRLVSARLRIAVAGTITIEDTANGLLLWTCNQSWNPATATFNTRDGSTPWSQAWTNGTAQNVGTQLGSFPLLSNPLEGGCGYLDITSTLQAWINGSNNNGLVLGYLSESYDSFIALSEYGVPALRPTLILEYYDVPRAAGMVFMVW